MRVIYSYRNNRIWTYDCLFPKQKYYLLYYIPNIASLKFYSFAQTNPFPPQQRLAVPQPAPQRARGLAPFFIPGRKRRDPTPSAVRARPGSGCSKGIRGVEQNWSMQELNQQAFRCKLNILTIKLIPLKYLRCPRANAPRRGLPRDRPPGGPRG